jgi:hypothetical protein
MAALHSSLSRCGAVLLAILVFVQVGVVSSANNPTTSGNGGVVTISNTDRVIGSSGNTVVIQFRADPFKAAWPIGLIGVVPMTFSPSIFASDALPESETESGGTSDSGCGACCDWSLGPSATYYRSSTGLLDSHANPVLTGGTQISSSCTLVPHPSFGNDLKSNSDIFETDSMVNNNANTKSDKFVMRMSGFINMPSSGMWTFYTESDDGSRLWFGTGLTLVVNNNALQPLTEVHGTANVACVGWQAITIEFSQGNGGAGLLVRWKKSGSTSKAQTSACAPSTTLTSPLALAFYGGTTNIGAGSIALFLDCNHSGMSASKTTGKYDMNSMGVSNDALSSLLVPAGLQVIVHQHSNLSGTAASISWQNNMRIYNCNLSLSLQPNVSNSDGIPVCVRSDSLRFLGSDMLQLRLCRFYGWSGTSTVSILSTVRIIESMCFAAIVALICNTFRGTCCRASQRAVGQLHRDDPNKSGSINTDKPNYSRCRVMSRSIRNSLLFLVVIISFFRGGSAQQVRYVRVTAAATEAYLQISYLCVCDSINACDENSNQLSKNKVATASTTYSPSDAAKVTQGTAGLRNFGNVCQSALFTPFLPLFCAQVLMMMSNSLYD